jgi:hypothetical protein
MTTVGPSSTNMISDLIVAKDATDVHGQAHKVLFARAGPSGPVNNRKYLVETFHAFGGEK